MKKKIISLILICALFVTILPSGVSALSSVNPSVSKNDEGNVSKNSKYSLTVKKPTSKQIKQVGSETEYYKQLFTEQINEYYDELYYSTYINSVKSSIDKAYKNAIDKINSINSKDDLFITDSYGDDIVSLDVNLPYATMVTLSSWTYNYVSSDSSYSVLKEKGIDAINSAFICFDRDDFNAYYNTIIDSYHDEYLGYVNSSNNFYTLAEAFSRISFLSTDYSDFNYVDIYFDIDDEDDMYGICNYNAYGSSIDDDYYDFLDSMGMSWVPGFALGQEIYSKGEIYDVINTLTAYANAYFDNQLVLKNYEYSASDIFVLNDFLEEISKGYNPDVMYTKYNNFIESMENKTGVKYEKLNSTTIFRISNGINKLAKKYLDRKVYSDSAYKKNYMILDNAGSAVNVTYDCELPSDFLVKLEKLLKKTPTRAVELSNAKKLYTNKLNTFKNNKRYNQSKVVPIVNEGISKISKATSVNSVRSIYSTYYNKALLTINKYKITTSKVGKGVITSSKTVNYGSSVTISMTPSKGYKLSKLYIDGKRVSVKSKYTFKNVVMNHSVKAVFVKK